MLSLAWLFVKLIGLLLAMQFVSAFLVAFATFPAIFGGYWVAGRLTSRRSSVS